MRVRNGNPSRGTRCSREEVRMWNRVRKRIQQTRQAENGTRGGGVRSKTKAKGGDSEQRRVAASNAEHHRTVAGREWSSFPSRCASTLRYAAMPASVFQNPARRPRPGNMREHRPSALCPSVVVKENEKKQVGERERESSTELSAWVCVVNANRPLTLHTSV